MHFHASAPTVYFTVKLGKFTHGNSSKRGKSKIKMKVFRTFS